MQENKTVVLEKLKQRINAMISMYETAVYERNDLEKKYNNATEQINKLKTKVENLENRLKTLELADAFSGTSKDSSEAKAKIDAIIKEIDHCLELMTI